MTGLFEGITSKLKYENRIKEVILYFCTVPSFYTIAGLLWNIDILVVITRLRDKVYF